MRPRLQQILLLAGLTLIGADLASASGERSRAVILDANDNYIGNGVLIDDDHVITVGQVLDTSGLGSYSGLKVRLGDFDLNVTEPTEQVRGVKYFTRHPDAGFGPGSFPDDVVLLSLDAPVIFDCAVQPARLPPQPSFGVDPFVLNPGDAVSVHGWGPTSDCGIALSPIPLTTPFEVMDPVDAEMAFALLPLPPGEVALSYGSFALSKPPLHLHRRLGAGVYAEDLGGPILVGLVKTYVIGPPFIFGEGGCFDLDYPAICEDTDSHATWIYSNIWPVAPGTNDPACVQNPGCGLLQSTFEAGIQDDFAPPFEPSAPVPELQALLMMCSHGTKGFDDPGTNQCFGHSLTGLPGGIATALFEIRLRSPDGWLPGSGSPFGSNDTISLRVAGKDAGWVRPIQDIQSVDGSLPTGNDAILVLDLAALPNADGTTTDLLPMLNAYGRLDILVEDDTDVDYLSLRVEAWACTPGTAKANVTYGLSGAGAGTPWSWRIEFPNAPQHDTPVIQVPGVTGTALNVAAAFAESINDHFRAQGYDTTAQGDEVLTCLGSPTPHDITAFASECFGTTTLHVGAPSGFRLYVSPVATPYDPSCLVQLPTTCQFNPDIQELLVSGSDCNGNGLDDAFDIALGFSQDQDGNTIPDECEDCLGSVSSYGTGCAGSGGFVPTFSGSPTPLVGAVRWD